MKRSRRFITIICFTATFIADAGEQINANAKCVANQPTNAELQLLQGTWEGVERGDKGTSKVSDSKETRKRKLGENDLRFLETGVFEAPPQSHRKIIITITGNPFHFTGTRTFDLIRSSR